MRSQVNCAYFSWTCCYIIFYFAGILPIVIEELDLSYFQAGLLQSAFVVSYAVFAPIVGYLGDRYSRKLVKSFRFCVMEFYFFIRFRLILAVGFLIWGIVSLTASYMTTFETLFALRCLGGKWCAYRFIIQYFTFNDSKILDKALAKQVIVP